MSPELSKLLPEHPEPIPNPFALTIYDSALSFDFSFSRLAANAIMMSLFRQEVMAHRVDRLHRDVSLALTVSWQVIRWGILATVVAAIAFLSAIPLLLSVMLVLRAR